MNVISFNGMNVAIERGCKLTLLYRLPSSDYRLVYSSIGLKDGYVMGKRRW